MLEQKKKNPHFQNIVGKILEPDNTFELIFVKKVT